MQTAKSSKGGFLGKVEKVAKTGWNALKKGVSEVAGVAGNVDTVVNLAEDVAAFV
jgi:hypothetical protein